jgi:(1->4)-alpha-D-glucan 1-alpha-D-glucosylmutase
VLPPTGPPATDRVVVTTYRLQLRDGLTLHGVIDDGWLDHAAELGASHLYLAPVLTAAPGSTHGYDVVDPCHVDPVLGGDDAFERLAAAAAARGLGLVVDIVPNHMAADPAANRWWWDVLRNGPSSEHAALFDVDPRHPEARLRGKVVLPVLDDRYGRVLDAGRLTLGRP